MHCSNLPAFDKSFCLEAAKRCIARFTQPILRQPLHPKFDVDVLDSLLWRSRLVAEEWSCVL